MELTCWHICFARVPLECLSTIVAGTFVTTICTCARHVYMYSVYMYSTAAFLHFLQLPFLFNQEHGGEGEREYMRNNAAAFIREISSGKRNGLGLKRVVFCRGK